jgi:hypothetical protein
MAHKFDRSKQDPYVEAAQQVERHVFRSRGGLDAGASQDIYGTLGTAIVTALGDIAHQAFRHGVNQPDHVKGLAKAVAAASEDVLLSYLGEVDPEPAIVALENDPRISRLTAESRDKLTREIEKTRQYESLVLHAQRLPQLLEYAGSLGLAIHEDAIEEGALLVPGDETRRVGTG